MRHHGPSLFASLGQAFDFYQQKKRGLCSLKCDPRATKFEYFLAERLCALTWSLKTELASLGWMHRALDVVASSISDAQDLIPELVSPLSEWDEQWVSEYLDDTVKLLDVLNTVRQIIADIEHRQMLLKLAVCILDSKCGTIEQRYQKARNSICDYAAATQPDSSLSKVQSSVGILRVLNSQAIESKLLTQHKGRNFLTALYGAKVVAIFILGIIITSLSRKGTLWDLEWHVPEHFMWSKPLLGLSKQVKELMEKGTQPVVHELGLLDVHQKNLQDLLAASISTEEESHKISVEAQELKVVLKSVEQGLELVRQQTDRLFHIIVSNRNSLLFCLRQAS